jgi:hypothetical protein
MNTLKPFLWMIPIIKEVGWYNLNPNVWGIHYRCFINFWGIRNFTQKEIDERNQNIIQEIKG